MLRARPPPRSGRCNHGAVSQNRNIPGNQGVVQERRCVSAHPGPGDLSQRRLASQRSRPPGVTAHARAATARRSHHPRNDDPSPTAARPHLHPQLLSLPRCWQPGTRCGPGGAGFPARVSPQLGAPRLAAPAPAPAAPRHTAGQSTENKAPTSVQYRPKQRMPH